MPDERTQAPDAADLQREIDRLRQVRAEAYQLVGVAERRLETLFRNSW